MQVGGQSIDVATGGCVLDDAYFIANGINVPTMGQWGIIALALLSSILGLVVLQKSRLSPTVEF